MKKNNRKNTRRFYLTKILFGLFMAMFVFSQENQTILHPQKKVILNLFPKIYKEYPQIPSPFTAENGMEIVVGLSKKRTYTLIPVTQRNGDPWIPDQGLWGIGDQLEVDGVDFPTLDRTGLHSEIELARTKTITGLPISEITESGRPGKLSDEGFMSFDEDILSVLKGDNRLAKSLALTHPQLAKPLFHVWNLIGQVGHNIAENYEYILYNHKKVFIKAHRTKPGQLSLFDDGYRGGSNINIWRELAAEEKDFLQKKYSRLTANQMTELIIKLSKMLTGELEPYYIMHYGFYEGHTAYRTDPVAIAFIFGLRSLEEIEAAFPERIYEVLTEHFIRENF